MFIYEASRVPFWASRYGDILALSIVGFATIFLAALLMSPTAILLTLEVGWPVIALVAAGNRLMWAHKRPRAASTGWPTTEPLCLAFAGTVTVAPLSMHVIMTSLFYGKVEFGMYARVAFWATILSTIVLIGIGVQRIVHQGRNQPTMPLWKFYLLVVGASCPWLMAGLFVVPLGVAITGIPMLLLIRAFDRAAQNLHAHPLPIARALPVIQAGP